MSPASVFIISYAFLSLGAVIGWIARGRLVREQVEQEPSQFSYDWEDNQS